VSDAVHRPIGIFDSGVGGLTVARALLERLPGEALHYFGDTARVPYGSKSGATVRRYSREAAAYLLSRDVKALVIACNTATAYAGEVLEDELQIPVIGVIEPGARAAVAASRTGRIGVVGTTATIGSGAYDLAVRRLLPEARVYAQPCPLFVPLVEEGLVEHPATHLVAEEYLRPLREMDVDVVILGCTHYPLLRDVVARIMGPGVRLVDSARETAIELARVLEEAGLLRPEGPPPVHRFSASDSPLRFREVGRQLVGDIVQAVEAVDVDGYAAAAGATGAGEGAGPRR
jgi:glutamate racemase